MHSENCQPCHSKQLQRQSGARICFFFSFVSVWTKETNLSPLLVLKDTRDSVTSVIKLLQRQTLRAAGNNRLGKCFEFFMKHT